MERRQFTFYESFFRAVSRIKKKADRADAYDAICAYALDQLEPDLDKLPDAAAIAFDLIRPTLDASRRKAESGKAGGRAKQTPSKTEADLKQTAREKEKEVEVEKEVEKEDECPPPAPSAAAAVYLDRVNASASQASLEELAAFERAMGREVCVRAMDIALDNKKPTWAYIRAILRRWSGEGVKCLADVEALETRHDQGKAAQKSAAGGTKPQPAIPGEADRRAREDMERMREFLKKEGGGVHG